MAHDERKCRGRWQNSQLNGVLEGNGLFEVDPHSGADDIGGTHRGRGNARLRGKCTGEKMKFGLIDSSTGEVICYFSGQIIEEDDKFKIRGKFKKPLNDEDLEPAAAEGRKKSDQPPVNDDWTAERPIT
jgi:hypothetical protein